jgi:hypothetical protein
MMTLPLEFRGYTITPASYENSDMPEHWFPLALVESQSSDPKRVVLPPVRGVARTQADAAAVAEAKRRIVANNL